MTNIFNKMNQFFIADKGEGIHVSDLVWFYGTMGFFTIIFFVSIALHIK